MALPLHHCATPRRSLHTKPTHTLLSRAQTRNSLELSRRPPLFSLSLSSSGDADPAVLVSSVGTPSPTQSNRFDHRHAFVLNAVACVVALSMSWFCFSAIPALLAFKRAAESLKKLLDVTREELPDTMAAIRLSGMEISDLTMELSDIGQEITQGVRSSTRAVRLAEERLRRLTTSPTALVQAETSEMSKREEPPLARRARSLREGIVRGRALLGTLPSFTRLSLLAWNFFAALRQKLSP